MRRRRFQKKMVTKVSSSSNREKLRIYCLFCYKLTDIEDTEDSLSQADKLITCHRFYKHIGGGEVPFTDKMYGAKCGVCDNCFCMIDNHCQIHYEIECLRLKLQWQVYKLCRVMKYAGKATSRVKDFEKSLLEEVSATNGSNFNLERALNFREKIYNKCSQRLKKKNPRVVLSTKGKWKNISVSKEDNVLSSKSKVSKSTQTINDSIQDFNDHGNTKNSNDKNNGSSNDGKVTSSNNKVVLLDKYTQVETENTEQISNDTSQKISYHESTEEFKYGKRAMLLESPVFKCIICDKVFESNTVLVEHERDKHWHLITGNKSMEHLSNDTTSTVNNNLTEKKWHGNIKSVSHCCTTRGVAADPTFACAICGVLYSSLNSLNVHLITTHKMLITPVTNQIKDAAVEVASAQDVPQSQDNGVDKKPDEVAVRKSPRRGKRFQAECPKCGKIFKCADKSRAKEKVRRHLQTKMHGGIGRWKLCDTCGRRFKTKHLLKMHKRSPCETTVSDGDSTSGPGNLLVLREIFKCCHCVKTFSTQEKLASHEGARECFDEDESEASGYDEDKRKAVKLAKPVFAASCPKCWKVFERCNQGDLQAALNRHLYESKMHGGKHSWKHLCSFCGVRYQNRSRLVSHMKRYHNEESSNTQAGKGNSSGIDYLINTGSFEHFTLDRNNPIDESNHHGDQMNADFSCAFCDFHTNAYDLMDHENTYHSYYVSEEKLKCSRCPQIFDMEMSQNYSSLRAHFLQAHLGIEANIHEEIETRS